jgi:tetratricopeptide (TPR) repeat protein
VCLIVRNEEAMLPGCLASLRGLAHEIIVVDTGSTDHTMEIARRHGALVSSFPWCDDFAAARNASLALAHGDWILVLDADERLAPGAAAVLQRAVARADFDCGMLPMHEAVREGAPLADVVAGAERLGEPSYLPRLLRRTGDLRFEGIVHESILGWLEARGAQIAFVEAPLVHLGASAEVRMRRAKGERNIALLEKAARARPADPTPLGYLAHEHLEAGRAEAAREVVERGWMLVDALSGAQRPSVLRLATARARLQLEAADLIGMLATVARAERLDGPHADFDFLRGSARELLGLAASGAAERQRELTAALAAYRAAVGRRGSRYAQAFVVGASSWAGATRSGCVLLSLGRVAEARAAFTDALAQRAGHTEAELGLVECTLLAGEPEAALAAVEPLLDERPDGWLLGAAALDALGLMDDFRMFLARVRERAARGYLSPHRRERHGTLHGALAAYLGVPMAVPGRSGALYALLAREPLPSPESAPYPVDVVQLDRLLANLVAVGRGGLAAALLDPRAEQVMPGLHEAVARGLGKLGLSTADDGEPAYVMVGAFGAAELETLRGLLSVHPDLTVREASGMGAVLGGGADGPALRAWLAERAGGARRAVLVGADAALHFAAVARHSPASRFVLLVRDVRALVATQEPDLLGEPGDAAARALCWAAYVRRAREDAAALPGRYLEIRYEDLLGSPAATVRRLLAFLGEPEDPQVMRHLVDAYPGRPDRWRRELAAEARRGVEMVAREALTTLGYEVGP